MQKTMYAIIDKTTREILSYDWDGYDCKQLLLEETEKTAKAVLCGITFPLPKELYDEEPSYPVEFNNAEIVPVTLTWE